MLIESLKLGLSFISLLLIIAALFSMTHSNMNSKLGTSEPKKPSPLYRKLKHTNLLATKKWCSPLSVSLIGLAIPSMSALLGILITEKWLPTLILFIIVVFMEFIFLNHLILRKKFDILDSMKMFFYLIIHESVEDDKKGPSTGTINAYMNGTMHLCIKFSNLEAALSNGTLTFIDAMKHQCDNFLFQDLLNQLTKNEDINVTEKAKTILEESGEDIETQKEILKSRIESSMRKLIFLSICLICLLIYWTW